ncbi:MAG: 1-(5-phosphoribosyl)-5-[(5-phosphoribosylamino)methylideneamino]imidazole-4-carboxamide isomerase [Candidatus Omnitrophota bacterium]|nr:1-(5-phosphoribosyl)-5-[(5-phosphoribosylamino)methylideneamino]imidazole-4-carboxamide isomerase [Candidatus Omnitrophota bacterium]
MRVIPAIDLIDGKTVRLEQGKYDCKLTYDIDPVSAACKWESLGAKLLHIVDLDGAKEGRPVNISVIEKIARAVNIPVEAGGGFRTQENIQQVLDKGVWRVVVGSRAFEDMSFTGDCVKTFGEKVIFSLDVKELRPSVRGWEETVDLDVSVVLDFFINLGVKEIIYTDIKRDGMLSGPNIEALKEILQKTTIKIISAGGVKTIEHIKMLKKLEKDGLSGVIIGRALYEDTLDLKEAVDVGEADNSVS